MATICFTGHRPNGFPWGYNEKSNSCELLKYRLKSSVIAYILKGYDHFIVGGAQGFDTYAAETVIHLKDTYSFITLEIAIPCPNQCNRWSIKSKERYNSILNEADKKTIISERYTPYCMQKRNEYMVDHADLVISAWNGNSGGTENTIKYAKHKGIPIKFIEIK